MTCRRRPTCSNGLARTAADDGSYWTGIVYPEPVLFPFDEHTSYTAAAVVLAVDAITRATPASDVFVPF